MHAMAAAVLQQPLLAIDAGEAAQLAIGIQRVSRHYDVRASAEMLDWANLVMALLAVYGTRIAAIKIQAGRVSAASADAASSSTWPGRLYSVEMPSANE